MEEGLNITYMDLEGKWHDLDLKAGIIDVSLPGGHPLLGVTIMAVGERAFVDLAAGRDGVNKAERVRHCEGKTNERFEFSVKSRRSQQ